MAGRTIAVLAALGMVMASPAAGAEPSSTVGGERPAGATIDMPFGGGVSIPVTVDVALVASVEAHYAELYHANGPLFVMVDTYDTDPAAGRGCAAGHERWVRVLDIARKAEIFHRHVESCAKGLTVAAPMLSVAADGASVTVHRTGAPEITIALDPEAGTARIVE